jgi:2-dehydro-3-deoxyphosphogluconate aldolase / (4S)-4-hydroxy-2-oxoglutarate aldolase
MRMTSPTVDVLETVRTDRVVAVIRAPRIADPVGLAGTLAEAGIRCVEFTFTIPDVLRSIEAAARSGALVGAGTVLGREHARAAVEAGARFVVSPVLRLELVQAVPEVPVFLAGLTPTEILTALEAGSAAVKLFPARQGGPQYVSDLLGPFPEALLIPSGGVNERTAPEYLAAGAVAVYCGSNLAPPEAVASGDHAEIGRRAEMFLAALG